MSWIFASLRLGWKTNTHKRLQTEWVVFHPHAAALTTSFQLWWPTKSPRLAQLCVRCSTFWDGGGSLWFVSVFLVFKWAFRGPRPLSWLMLSRSISSMCAVGYKHTHRRWWSRGMSPIFYLSSEERPKWEFRKHSCKDADNRFALGQQNCSVFTPAD